MCVCGTQHAEENNATTTNYLGTNGTFLLLTVQKERKKCWTLALALATLASSNSERFLVKINLYNSFYFYNAPLKTGNKLH